ncbi:hypothetical protein IWX47DRAFT_871392, partial [Phyllosticta citricarpa]
MNLLPCSTVLVSSLLYRLVAWYGVVYLHLLLIFYCSSFCLLVCLFVDLFVFLSIYGKV